jgi:hypothetical protein
MMTAKRAEAPCKRYSTDLARKKPLVKISVPQKNLSPSLDTEAHRLHLKIQ